MNFNQIFWCKSTDNLCTCSFQLDTEDRCTFRTIGHNNAMGGVTLQADCQSGVAIRADSRDAEMPVVVGKGKEFPRAKDGSPFSSETPSTTNRTQQDVFFTHACVTLSIHLPHHTLQGAI